MLDSVRTLQRVKESLPSGQASVIIPYKRRKSQPFLEIKFCVLGKSDADSRRLWVAVAAGTKACVHSLLSGIETDLVFLHGQVGTVGPVEHLGLYVADVICTVSFCCRWRGESLLRFRKNADVCSVREEGDIAGVAGTVCFHAVVL